jgi:hypothetical protein
LNDSVDSNTSDETIFLSEELRKKEGELERALTEV